ncbi:MAG: hypothetical protein KTR21_10495 [Rhodobacteraceae bacterium]|nr:hypothetical protein [Paracoccaceae bacterium]
MSIGAEILLRAIAGRMDGAALLSEFGDGCPLLNAAAHPPIRLANRPVGGVMRRADLTTFAPPLDITHRAADSARVAQRRQIIVDAVAGDTERLLALARSFETGAVAALRVRGGAVSDPGLKLIFESPSGDDHVHLRRDLATDDLVALATQLMQAEIDEFDALTGLMNSAVITSLRHGAGASDVHFDPASLLDQPDTRQITAALGDGQAIMAADGGCALYIPQLSGAPKPVSVLISGLEDGAPNPDVFLSNAPDWSIDLRRNNDGLLISARPAPHTTPLVSLFLEIKGPHSPNAVVREVASGIARSRGAWEIWDEAQQQLELEESW